MAAAAFRDGVVHHAIVRVIQALFEQRFIEDSFASRPGKGTRAAMRRASQFARRFEYALKCDVQKLASLQLGMHPDKYRLLPTRCGVDFVGFVVCADGRIRVRAATARRFQERFRAMRWDSGSGLPPV